MPAFSQSKQNFQFKRLTCYQATKFFITLRLKAFADNKACVGQLMNFFFLFFFSLLDKKLLCEKEKMLATKRPSSLLSLKVDIELLRVKKIKTSA